MRLLIATLPIGWLLRDLRTAALAGAGATNWPEARC